jgi:hypothetical protein
MSQKDSELRGAGSYVTLAPRQQAIGMWARIQQVSDSEFCDSVEYVTLFLQEQVQYIVTSNERSSAPGG